MITEDLNINMEVAIEQAKQCVMALYGISPDSSRKWLESTVENCSEKAKCNDNHKVRTFVLEGHPVKGTIIANYGQEVVIAFDMFMRQQEEWRIRDILKMNRECLDLC